MTDEALTQAEFIARVLTHKADMERMLSTESFREAVAVARQDDDGRIFLTVDVPKLTGIVMGVICALAYDDDYRHADELYAEVERIRLGSILGDVDLDGLDEGEEG